MHDRELVYCLMVPVCDIAAICKPWDVHKGFVEDLYKEFNEQVCVCELMDLFQVLITHTFCIGAANTKKNPCKLACYDIQAVAYSYTCRIRNEECL